MGRALLLEPGRELTVGRLVLVPTWPCVPAVGLVLLGRAVVPLFTLPEALPVVGRVAETLLLIEPLAVRLPTLAPFWLRPPLLGTR